MTRPHRAVRGAGRRLRLAAAVLGSAALSLAGPSVLVPSASAAPVLAGSVSALPPSLVMSQAQLARLSVPTSDESAEPSEQPTESAERPDVPGLEPVDAGSTAAEALPITAGKYVDLFPKSPDDPDDPEAEFDLKVYQFDRTIPGSVVRFGLTLLDEQNSAASRLQMVAFQELGDGNRRTCGNVLRDAELFPASMPVTTYGGTSFATNDNCANAESLLIVVGGLGARAPQEGTPYELDVQEYPLPTNLDDLSSSSYGAADAERLTPVAAEDVEQQVEPGPVRPEATMLAEDGGYHVDLPLGRVSWFAVDMAVDDLLAVDAAVDDAERINQGGTLEVRIVAPEGGAVGEDTGGNAQPIGVFDPVFPPVGTIGTGVSRVQSQTQAIGPGGLKLLSASGYTSATTGVYSGLIAPGPYYVAVYAQNISGDDEATLPMTLTMRRFTGTFASISDDPMYAGGAEPEPIAGPETDVEPSSYDGAAAVADREAQLADAEAEEEQATEDRTIPWWAYVAGALLVVVVGAGAFLLSRRGRRSAPQQAQGWPPGGPGPGGPAGPGGPPGWGGPGGPGPGGPGPGGPGPGGPGPGPGPGGPGGPPGWGGPGAGGPSTPATVIRPGPHPGQSGQQPPPQQPPPQQPQPDPAPPTRQRPDEGWEPTRRPD